MTGRLRGKAPSKQRLLEEDHVAGRLIPAEHPQPKTFRVEGREHLASVTAR